MSGADRIPCNCDATSSCSKCSGTADNGIITATNCGVDVSKFKEKTVELDLTCMCKGDVWKSCDDCQGGCSGSDNSISELMKPACKMYKYEG